MKIEIILQVFATPALCHTRQSSLYLYDCQPAMRHIYHSQSLVKSPSNLAFHNDFHRMWHGRCHHPLFCNVRLIPFTRLATQHSSRFFHFSTCHTSAIKILTRLFACYRIWKVNLPRRRWNNVTTINIYSNDTKLKVLWRQRFAYQMIWSLIN